LQDREHSIIEPNVETAVRKEFEEIIVSHGNMDPDVFNDDENYKQLLTEAIVAKSLAIQKSKMCFDWMKESNDRDIVHQHVQRILDQSLKNFADQGTVIELETGTFGFPWADVIQKSASINFGEWSPKEMKTRARQGALDKIIADLASNENLRMITVGTNQLIFADGWATKEIDWQSSAAVKHSPDVTALIIYCFNSLSSICLR
jgi:hypothetical protein